MGVRNVFFKVTFKVIQWHSQWCHSIGHVRFPNSAPQSTATMSFPCTVNEVT